MKKQHKIAKLPTEDNSYLGMSTEKVGLSYDETMHDSDVVHQCFHLYILSDEEIKEGDRFYNGVNVEKALRIESQLPFHGCKKIIATTDPKLVELICKGEEDYFNYDNGDKLNTNKLLPRIPQSLVKHYAKHQPEEVELEYDYNDNMPLTTPGSSVYRLKLQDNEVVWVEPYYQKVGRINRVKLNEELSEVLDKAVYKTPQEKEYTRKELEDKHKMYSSSDVEKFCKIALTYGRYKMTGSVSDHEKDCKQWLETHLKYLMA